MDRRGRLVAALILFQVVLAGAPARAGATAPRAPGTAPPLVLYREILPVQIHQPTPLMLAAARRDLAQVSSLLAQKAPVDAVVEGRTALMVAAAYGDPRVIHQILAAGAQVDRRDDQGQSALFYAIHRGQRPAVAALLAGGADANLASGPNPTYGQKGRLPLTLALGQRSSSTFAANQMAASARASRQRRTLADPVLFSMAAENYVDGDWEGIVETLLGKGADPNRKDPEGDSALFLALKEHDTALAQRLRRAGARDDLLYAGLDPARSLAMAMEVCDGDRAGQALAAGADPNAAHAANAADRARSEDVFSAALGCPGLTMVQLLLDHGFDPKRRDRLGYDGVLLAAVAGRADAVKLLLARGGDPNSAGVDTHPSSSQLAHRGEDTALLYAIQRKSLDTVQALLAGGADPNRPGLGGATPLHKAVLSNQIEIAKLLLEHGADPNLKKEGDTPLSRAVQLGEIEMAKLLLDHKADPNATILLGKSFRSTPLHQAVYGENPALLRLLLAAGADAKAQDGEGSTALDVARSIARRRGDRDKAIQEVLQLLAGGAAAGRPSGR